MSTIGTAHTQKKDWFGINLLQCNSRQFPNVLHFWQKFGEDSMKIVATRVRPMIMKKIIKKNREYDAIKSTRSTKLWEFLLLLISGFQFMCQVSREFVRVFRPGKHFKKSRHTHVHTRTTKSRPPSPHVLKYSVISWMTKYRENT